MVLNGVITTLKPRMNGPVSGCERMCERWEGSYECCPLSQTDRRPASVCVCVCVCVCLCVYLCICVCVPLKISGLDSDIESQGGCLSHAVIHPQCMGGGVAAAHEGVIFHSLLFSCWLVVGCSSNQEHACRHYGPCLTVLVGYKKRIEMIERNNE